MMFLRSHFFIWVLFLLGLSACQRVDSERLKLQKALSHCQKQVSQSTTSKLCKPTSIFTQKKSDPPVSNLPIQVKDESKLEKRWSASNIRIVRLPRSSHRGKRPTEKKRLRYVRNMFWRYMRIRRRRLKRGISSRTCRRQRNYLKKYPFDPHASLTTLLCKIQHHFRQKYYFQVDFSGLLIIHARRWNEKSIRAFLARYRVLFNRSRRLGFARFLFVSDRDLKRRHARSDFQNKWYGRLVSFRPIP